MQSFTYAKKGAALRQHVTMLCAMLMADVAVFVVVTLLVRGMWRWIVPGAGVLLVTVALWALTHRLRTYHSLDAERLRLRFGRFSLDVPREAIDRVELRRDRVPGRVEVPTSPVGYEADSDTLYVLADRKGLAVVQLRQPLEAKAGRLGQVQFTRVVVSLDEPERFAAAFAGAASVDVGMQVALPVAADVAVAAAAPVASGAQGAAGAAPALRLDGLRKCYDDFTAVAGLHLSVAPGEVLAFLGANGAGKTTTIRMMTGLLRPTAGRVFIGGHDLWTDGTAARRLVGYVPDVPLLYEGLTAREFLWLMAGLHGLPRPEGRRRADVLLALLQLERWGDHLLRTFSLGMKRKMAIAAALVHRPRVLLLDEVTNGLDPRAAREIKDLIAASAREGTAVFLTTHLLDVVQELAHRIAVIDRGELRALGTVDELRRQVGRPEAGLEELFLTLTGSPARTREEGIA
jgi:ABC-2 type transport system ATP-binding protein